MTDSPACFLLTRAGPCSVEGLLDGVGYQAAEAIQNQDYVRDHTLVHEHTHIYILMYFYSKEV